LPPFHFMQLMQFFNVPVALIPWWFKLILRLFLLDVPFFNVLH
jgi:hypothetical protein